MPASQLTDPPAPPVEEVSLAIGGMTCGSCAARLEDRLNAITGVHATVNYATERARIALLDPVSPARLMHEVQAAGFTATVLADRSVPADLRVEADRRVRYYGRRLAVAGLLMMPLGDASVAFWVDPSLRFPGWQWLLIAMSLPIITWCAWPFYSAALRNARHGAATMDTLVSVGILSATAWSLYVMFFRDTSNAAESFRSVLAHQTRGAIYLDVAAGVTTFLLAGRFFEAWTRRRTGNALATLAAVGAKEVAVVDDTGSERLVPVEELFVGRQFVVRPGETVAADGEVVVGSSAIDRSAMTGESVPDEVAVGDRVVGGTVSVTGRLVVRATEVGEDTQLAHMLGLVERAQNDKAAAQRMADRVAGVFVPAVFAASLLTLTGWLLTGADPETAFNAALSVLIIACPCALGLATPLALMVASSQGAKFGIFFKGYQALERSRQIDTVVFDKTGTITSGRMVVSDVTTVPGVSGAELLRLAGALENASEHPVARAIARRATHEGHQLPAVADFEAQPGSGARGRVDGHVLSVGRASGDDDMPHTLRTRCSEWEAGARTVVLVSRDGQPIGAIGLGDGIRPSANSAVAELGQLGLHSVLVTGDNEAVARTVAGRVGIDDVIAGVSPPQKSATVHGLQEQGRRVAMVGDGINDGPALAAADLGIAIGTGTDVALNTAEIIITRDELTAVPTAVRLACAAHQTIRQNLVWAFGYNIVAIPLAACGLLNPLIAGAAMALSSGCVVWNSARLRHFSASPPPSVPASTPDALIRMAVP